MLYDEPFTRKVLPFLKSEYFLDKTERILFDQVHSFVIKYNDLPTVEALVIEIDNHAKINQEEQKLIHECLSEIKGAKDEKPNEEWLLKSTEKFCQDKAIYNAIMESIQILDEDKKTSHDKGAIPEILKDALGVSFDTHIGHDYFEDMEERFDFYHLDEEHVPFDLELMNTITKGGLIPKTLNVMMGEPGIGKTTFLCHVAASWLAQGKNVLYITLEMAEEWIAAKIDSNLLNVSADDLVSLPRDMYDRKVEKIRSQTPGKLIIKEYPTASAGVGHFRHLLNELHLKKNFVPDTLIVDYINICSSSRIRSGSNVNSYTFIKSIAEELRGLAVEANVPLLSATQVNREGYKNSDVGMESVAESWGLPATVDLLLAMISTEELEELNQIMIKQLKNRHNDSRANKRFVIGIDRAKMRFFDCEQTAQKDLMNEKDINTNDKSEKKDFSGFIV